MKIHEVSDLHIHPMYDLRLPPGGADVLLLPGDIVEYHELQDPIIRKKWDRFCAHVSSLYPKTFATMGNHEMYGTDRETAIQTFRALYKDFGIVLLEDEGVDLGDFYLYGTTLWTDMERENWFCLQAAKGMVDFEYIHWGSKLLTPYITTQWHKSHLALLKEKLSNIQKKIVVMTHHAPSWQSIHSDYERSNFNGAYASGLEETILDLSNITHWFHGHTHTPFDYMIGPTRVICNPTGRFEPNVVVEICL